jgi:hypothetical protein
MNNNDRAKARAQATREYHSLTRMLSKINPLRNEQSAAIYQEMKIRRAILKHSYNL